MSTLPRLLAAAALLTACSPDDPPADAGTTATQTGDASLTQASFTGEPQPTGTSATTTTGTGEPTTGSTGTTADPTTDALTGTSGPTTGTTGTDTTGTSEPGTDGTTTVDTTGTTVLDTTDTGTTGTGTTDTGTTGTTAIDTTDTGTTDTGTTDTTDTGDPVGDPVCGDGVVAGDELCDDGNRQQADACLNDCTSGRALLALAGLSQTPAAFGRFVPGPGWTVSEAGTSVAEAAFAPLTSGAIVVVRRLSLAPQDNNELLFTTWSQGQPDKLTGFTEVGDFGFALDGPALAAHGDATLLSFLGTDNKHYWAQRSGGVWGPFTGLPASLQVQAFGPSAAALAGEDPGAYAVYAGDNGLVYTNYKSSPGGAWSTSTQASPPPVVKTLTPAAVVDADDDLVVAYVRASDGQIGVVKLLTPQNAWTAEVTVHPQAVSAAEVALVRTDAGAYYLAWRSADGKSVAVARGAAFDQWSAPVIVESGPAMQPPALAPGTLGAEAELVYVADGALRHARLSGETAVVADVPGAVGVTTRAAVLRVQLAP